MGRPPEITLPAWTAGMKFADNEHRRRAATPHVDRHIKLGMHESFNLLFV